MKPTDPATRARVLDLRRSHSLREVADLTGLPLGTVKALCSRAGTSRDNLKHREFFRLPDPVPTSSSTAVAIPPDLPPREAVTGLRDLDALLWLRKVVDTADEGYIARALQAVERIKTPADELERAYGRYLADTTGSPFVAAFGSINFADLQGHARRVLATKQGQAAALALFGTVEAAFADQPTEAWCIEVCEGVPADGIGFLDDVAAAARFDARIDLAPWTLADVQHECAYWRDLYRLRNNWMCGDGPPEVDARKDYMLTRLGAIRPRDRTEALATFEFIRAEWEDDSRGVEAVLRHLVGSGWPSQ